MPDVAPGTTKESAITIGTLNEGLRAIVEQAFSRVWIRGEVTGFKVIRGHWYFTMRDATAQISCVVWNKDQWAIPAAPDEGMQVVALTRMTAWPAKGTVQLRVTRMEATGDGLWRKAMEQTVARLKAEGLLAPERKRAIPRYPRCIAIVTSSSGAAVRDIIAVANRRRPGIRIVVSPAVVQGEGAVDSICAAIRRATSLRYVDVVIVGRGGGSSEDLWAFNDERVVRAVVAHPLPVVCGVGHEVDVTLADFAADHGVDISIEMHQNSIADNPWSCVHLLELIDRPNVGLNPDLGNLYWHYREPEATNEEAIVAIAPKTRYWHCKQLQRVIVPEQERAYFQLVPLPDGEIDYRFAIAAMVDAGYDGWLAIEGCRYGDQLRGDGRSVAYIRELLAEARG